MGYGLWAMDKGEAYRETIVIGDVYNAYTGEPLANVHIYFQGTDIGTTSSPEGMFLLRGPLDKKRAMVVSAVGYHTERVPIEAGQQVGVQIALLEKIPVGRYDLPADYVITEDRIYCKDQEN